MLNYIGLTGLLGFLLSINTASVLAQQEYPTLEQAGFIFKLEDCNTTSNRDVPLECEFLVQNTQESRRQFNLYANYSRVIDTEGNIIQGLSSNLGNITDSTNQYGGYSYQTGIELVNGIPVRGSIAFQKAPKGKIRLIDLRCFAPDTNYFNVEFIIQNRLVGIKFLENLAKDTSK
jgi:hypothetical protein